MEIVMRTLTLVGTFLLLSFTARAETILASVNGMVCAFCATGIEKTFQKQDAVEKVEVDLEKQLVTVSTKGNATIDDATVKRLIEGAGYEVTAIKRQ
jgi:copper chaperone CopZ